MTQECTTTVCTNHFFSQIHVCVLNNKWNYVIFGTEMVVPYSCGYTFGQVQLQPMYPFISVKYWCGQVYFSHNKWKRLFVFTNDILEQCITFMSKRRLNILTCLFLDVYMLLFVRKYCVLEMIWRKVPALCTLSATGKFKINRTVCLLLLASN